MGSCLSTPDNGRDGYQGTKIKQGDFETVGNVVFMDLIFAFVGKGIIDLQERGFPP